MKNMDRMLVSYDVSHNILLILQSSAEYLPWVFCMVMLMRNAVCLCLCLQRSEIIKAAYEPTDEECEWKADDEEELSVSKQVQVTPYLHALFSQYIYL